MPTYDKDSIPLSELIDLIAHLGNSLNYHLNHPNDARVEYREHDKMLLDQARAILAVIGGDYTVRFTHFTNPNRLKSDKDIKELMDKYTSHEHVVRWSKEARKAREWD